MELQGKKVTHDFLSLYSSDSSFHLQDPRSSSQGFVMKTRDFLQPLDQAEQGVIEASAADASASGATGRQAERALTGGVGSYTICHEAESTGARGKAFGSARGGFPIGLEAKPEPDYGNRSTSSTSYASYTQWDDKASRGHWPGHFAAAGGSGNSLPISVTATAGVATSMRHDSAPEKKLLTDAAASGFSQNYDGVDEDEEFVKREGSPSHKDLTIKVEGNGSCTVQRPNTPRSKHSATEQRRRSKINDRFQILRDLIPNTDQKRDKASFLLEVIEYIRFLQEKVQKQEPSVQKQEPCYSGWNKDNAKLMPWNSSRAPTNFSIPHNVVKSGPSSPAHVCSKKLDVNSIPAVPPTSLSLHNPPTIGVTSGMRCSTLETTTSLASNLDPTLNFFQAKLFPHGRETSVSKPQHSVSEADRTAIQDRSPWLRPCSLADSAMSNQILKVQEELRIDDGTISVSTAYSHGLLNTLTLALQSSGVDLSQANISVQINLGKRTVNRRPGVAPATSTVKEHEDPVPFIQAIGLSRVRPDGEESSQASKRIKAHS